MLEVAYNIERIRSRAKLSGRAGRQAAELLFLLTRRKFRRGPEKTKPLKAIRGIICFSK